MRFTANGPNISDELLNARDQGRVVFICGAGVSRAKADLPDFWGLAEKVANALGILPEENISQIIQSSKKPKTDGFISISADRLFGMLEQDFEIDDIYSAVSGALKHHVDCDLTAHQILIDLATTREGLVRIVTTNFDLLFEACNRNLLSHVPPKLPDPKRPKEFNGIVYLHGRVDDEYFGAKADGFVLSSSEFGQAYLADGWATRFIKEILDNYIVVFVGYSADDPPIQYLLEALKKYPAKRNDIYAFHAKGNDEAQSHWVQKGVIPIVYSEASHHKELWETLAAWAMRARNPVEWSKGVVREALKGPENLEPHIRGQVAHLASSYEGMKYFCGDESVPPSEWLAVFDPHIRLENVSSKAAPLDSVARSNIDKYGLDGESLNEIDPIQRSAIDPNAWNAFSLNHQDFLSTKTEHFSALVGEPKSGSTQLLPRLSRFAWWISKVCRETYAIEWALNQNFLHPILCQYISQSINEKNKETPSVIREAWRYILESKSKGRDDLGIYEIERQIKDEGWSNRIVRRFANFHAPWISTSPPFRGLSGPVGEVNALRLRDLVRLEVECGHLGRPAFDIPNEWLPSVIAAFRANLQSAIQLEIEINGSKSYRLKNIVSLHVENPNDNSYARTEGLSGLVYFYSKLLNTLISIDRSAAIMEIKSWSTIETTVLAHLNIWVASKSEIISIKEFLSIIQSLSNDDFWTLNNQRDLLITLSSRWRELDAPSKAVIEKIILDGPDNWGDDPIQFQSYSAHRVLERLHWLNAGGCQLSVDIGETTKRLAIHVPDWTNEQSRDAARSNEAQVRSIEINSDHSSLCGLSLDQILPAIERLNAGGLAFSRIDPFGGLVENKPVFAFRVLTLAAKKGVFPARLWDKFLSSSRRKADSKAFVQLIALRIASFKLDQLVLFLNSITSWLSDLDRDQFRQSHDSLIRAISKIIQTMAAFPEESGSSYVYAEREVDWMMESFSSPVRQLIESMFLDPDVTGEIAEIPVHWLSRVDSILNLPGNLQRLALVLLNRNLHWFYYHNSEWAEQALLSKLNSADALTRNAAWAGLLWSNNFTNDRLYRRLKPLLMEVLNSKPVSGQKNRLAQMLLSGWASIDSVSGQRYVSDAELISILIRSDGQFREAILSSATEWARSEESNVRWKPRLIELIALWPRRKSLKSANTTNCFLRIAFQENESFPALVKLILPLVSKSDQRSIDIFYLTHGDIGLIEKYPMDVLDLMHSVLPFDVHRWPYETGALLAGLRSANCELINDERLIELNRLWDSR